ncbi:Dipeptidyl peptidase 1 [Portunus trituberculatus]|uniref:Dipeptidyl peptidase 1 n=1 Tax=Portunus trituberculatus TaxID=210409 RepID=A0A5B7D0A7_PORTR|nr:Dipeptidyl peptidase 1 [Portunus trituberculatus]
MEAWKMTQLGSIHVLPLTGNECILQIFGTLLLVSIIQFVAGDTPANCLYEDVRGTWTFVETERLGSNKINCDTLGAIAHVKNFTLAFPDIATDELGNAGTWTMIYNQGFEVININQRSYFAFSYYETGENSVTSYCGHTFNGWSRDKTVRNWSCFNATKTTEVPPRTTKQLTHMDLVQLYRNDPALVQKINQVQGSWRAKVYPELEK